MGNALIGPPMEEDNEQDPVRPNPPQENEGPVPATPPQVIEDPLPAISDDDSEPDTPPSPENLSDNDSMEDVDFTPPAVFPFRRDPYMLRSEGRVPMRFPSGRVSLPRRTLNRTLRALSPNGLPDREKNRVESGDKGLFPPSLLDQLNRLNVSYPLLFRLTNKASGKVTHCGVLEFTADEDGRCYVPFWMMRNLGIDEGEQIQLENVSLPLATYSKFEPQAVDFLNITNPKAVLENSLRSFACLTTGDIISLLYNGKSYELRVVETKPGNAVQIIECDLNVDFLAPVGYEEPSRNSAKVDEPVSQNYVEAIKPGFVTFGGVGNRLDGPSVKDDNERPGTSTNGRGNAIRGIPDYDWSPGNLDFVRDMSIFAKPEKEGDEFVPFSGAGTTLREHKAK